jgi:hypothetical protein
LITGSSSFFKYLVKICVSLSRQTTAATATPTNSKIAMPMLINHFRIQE